MQRYTCRSCFRTACPSHFYYNYDYYRCYPCYLYNDRPPMSLRAEYLFRASCSVADPIARIQYYLTPTYRKVKYHVLTVYYQIWWIWEFKFYQFYYMDSTPLQPVRFQFHDSCVVCDVHIPYLSSLTTCTKCMSLTCGRATCVTYGVPLCAWCGTYWQYAMMQLVKFTRKCYSHKIPLAYLVFLLSLRIASAHHCQFSVHCNDEMPLDVQSPALSLHLPHVPCEIISCPHTSSVYLHSWRVSILYQHTTRYREMLLCSFWPLLFSLFSTHWCGSLKLCFFRAPPATRRGVAPRQNFRFCVSLFVANLFSVTASNEVTSVASTEAWQQCSAIVDTSNCANWFETTFSIFITIVLSCVFVTGMCIGICIERRHTSKSKRNVIVQAQCKYTWWKTTPRFEPLREREHGFWNED